MRFRTLQLAFRLSVSLRPFYFFGIFTPNVFKGICKNLVFIQYLQIPLNTLPQKYSIMMESF
jgi:hypothetical protein